VRPPSTSMTVPLHERGLVASKSQLFHYFPDGRSHLLLAVAC